MALHSKMARFFEKDGSVSHTLCGGSGVLWDSKNQLYIDKVNQTFDSEESLLSQYQCASETNAPILDSMGNAMLLRWKDKKNPKPLTYMQNYCTSLVFNVDESKEESNFIRPNFSKGICQNKGQKKTIVDHLYSQKSLPFTTCKHFNWKDGPEVQGRAFAFGVGKPCYDPRSTPKSLQDRVIKYPCSESTIKSRYLSEKALLLATNTYSPPALDYVL